MDGTPTDQTEWEKAGAFLLEGDAGGLKFGFDKNNLYLNVTGLTKQDFELYLKVPALTDGSPFSVNGQVLGFFSTHRLTYRSAVLDQAVELQSWDGVEWKSLPSSNFTYYLGQNNLEVAVPITDLQPTLDAGDNLLVKLITGETLYPPSAPGRMLVPDLGRTTWVLSANDPANDDHGPGTYTYPSDAVFKPGVFDLLNFQVGYDENNLVFRIEMRGPVENPWGSPNGVSIQLVDVYINTGSSTDQLMRNGRNTTVEDGWDYALSLAGWNYGFFLASDPEKAVVSVPVTIITDPGKNLILAKIPLGSIPGDPITWKFAVAVMSNDGYGINGVRDVSSGGGQWALGGAPADKNHSRLIDVLWPVGASPTQEEILLTYIPSQADPTGLSAADFPKVILFIPAP